jgi:integrase/recombinase XerC
MHTHLTGTLEGSLNAFLHSLEAGNKSPATLKAYRTDVLQFVIWLKENNLAACSPGDIVKADITEYMASLAQRNLTGTARYRKYSALCTYFRYLAEQDVIERSPAEYVAAPRREKRTRRYLTQAQYRALLSLAGANPRDYAILQVLIQQGLHVSELCNLTLDDVNLDAQTIKVLQGKGNKDRAHKLDRDALVAIRNYLRVRPQAQGRQLFLNYHGEPLGARGVEKLVSKYAVRAGLDMVVGPHHLRHTCGYHRVVNGMRVEHLKEMLGHEDIRTSQLYFHDAGLANLDQSIERTGL